MKTMVAMLTAALLLPVAAFAQEWKTYPYPDPGFAIQFPAPPMLDQGTLKTAAGTSLPMTRYSLRQDRIIYTLTVVDYSSAKADEKSTIAETEKSFAASGKVTVAIDARVNRSFGRELSVTGSDASRSAVAIFFVNQHLYTLVGQALPPNAIEKSGDAIRFQESLQFIGDNGGFGGGFGGGPGGGRGRGGFNPQAQAACAGKAIGEAVQLDTPGGPVAATCTLLARPNVPRNPPPPP